MSMPVPVQTKRNIKCNSTEDLSIHNNENKSLTIIENIFEDKRLERGAEYLCNSAPNELIQTCGRRTPKVKQYKNSYYSHCIINSFRGHKCTIIRLKLFFSPNPEGTG